MAETTGIAWARSTLNVWIGCTKVAPECDNCYAAEQDARRRWDNGRTHWGAGVPRYRTQSSRTLALRWNRLAEHEVATGELAVQWRGTWHRPGFWPVFGGSLMDWADNEVPDEWRADYWRLIRDTPALTWLLLTKRAPNVKRMLPEDFSRETFPHVWLGTTAGTQARIDADGMRLLEIDAAVHFLSIEPQLEAVDIEAWLRRARELGRRVWVINGGESGKDARPSDIAWARSIIRQCREAGAAPFVKQLGAHVTWNGFAGPGEHWPEGTLKNDTGRGHFRVMLRDRAGADPAEWPEDLRVQEFPA